MRITTRLRGFSIVTAATCAVLVPFLIGSFAEYRDAKYDYDLAEDIRDNYFERVSFRDQYFLFREDHIRELWEQSKAKSDQLLLETKGFRHSEADQSNLARLRRNIEDTTTIFHRIVSNTESLKTVDADSTRSVYEELDKRLISQMLLKAATVRNSVTALEISSEKRLEQTYQRLVMVVGLLAAVLAFVVILASVLFSRIIHRGLVPLNDGAEMLANGNLDYRIRIDGINEFADLAQSFNTMATKLHESTTLLEQKVANRTAALAESESRLRAIIDAEPEGISIVDAQARLKLINPAGLRMIEADSMEQVIGKSVLDFLVPEHREAFADMLQRGLAGESMQMTFETIGLNGRHHWVETHAVPIEENGQKAQLAITRDITIRKQTEDTLYENARQLQKLSRRVLEVQETERRRLAIELHDELGQALTAIKINLHAQEQFTNQSSTEINAENIGIVEAALQQVRRLALALRPSMLDDLGLVPALRWIAEQTEARGDLVVQLHAARLQSRLAPEIEIACFRIVQEALSNILRHAQARLVEIDLHQDADTMVLTVKDDGCGFDPAAMRERALAGNSMGVLGMEERATLIGGQLDIQSTPGQGSTVRLCCPLHLREVAI